MKKTLLLLASAAMLLVGCAKEKLGPDAGSGEMVTANFTAQMQGMPQTKSVTDGEGTKANRCVMEIYYKGVLYTRDVQPIGGMKATFTPRLVSNRTYDVLFWADCGEDLADKYYTTNAEGLGLQAVEMKATAYAANDDARDAFYTTESVPVGQQVSSETFTLTRPFAQVNIITTDAAVIKNANLYPDGVKMVYTAPTKFNLLTETLSEEKELTVTGIPYEPFDKTSAALTLEMDYLFTSEDKSALDIAFEASKTGESTVTSHSFTNIPVQRNYRTNIKGALLTTTGDWTATIVPGWNQPDEEVKYVEEGSIEAANQALAEGKTAILIKSPADAGDPIVIPSVADGKNISIKTEGTNGKTITFNGATGPANLYIASDAQELVINTPKTHVEVNSGAYTKVTAETSATTLVIAKGVTVETLEVNKGNVEIHGVVNALTRANGVKAEMYASDRATLINYINWAKAGDIAGLECDINLADNKWTPAHLGDNNFVATFDGRGYSIKNMTVEMDASTSTPYGGGFFYSMNGTMKNVTFINADVKSTEAGKGNVFGIAAGYAYGNVTFENIKVQESKVSAFGKVGGILGMAADPGTSVTTMKNCSLEDVEITGTYNVANYIGLLQNNVAMTGCSSSNVRKELSVRYGEDSYVTFDNVKVINNDEENPKYVLSSGKYWKYVSGSNIYYYSAFADCYNDIHYDGWKALDGTVDGLVFNTPETPQPIDLEPVATIGSKKYYDLPSALAALQQGETLEIWQAGEYAVQTLSAPSNSVIEAKVDGVVFNRTAGGSVTSYGKTSPVTVKNITWNIGSNNYQYFNCKVENCTINGRPSIHTFASFKGCTLINTYASDYCITTYGSPCTFENCTFSSQGKFVNVYGESQSSSKEVTATNCKFVNLKSSVYKAAFNIKGNADGQIQHTHVVIENCTTEGLFPDHTTTDGNAIFFDGGLIMFDDPAWEADVYAVVDGVTYYPYFTMDANGNYSVKNANGLKMAIKHWNALNAAGEKSITLADGTYNASDMAIFQNYANKSLLIKAENEKQAVITPTAGSKQLIFVVAGMSKTYAGHITIDGIKFDFSNASNKDIESDVISISDATGTNLPADEKALYSGTYHYGHDITIQNCEIIGLGSDNEHSSVVRTENQNAYNVKVQNCTIDKVGYVLTSKISTLAEVSGCTITDSKCVINSTVNNTEYKIIGNTISSYNNYCIRLDYGPIEVKGNNFNITWTKETGEIPTKHEPAIVVLRNSTGNMATITGNTSSKADDTMYDIYCKTSWVVNGTTIPAENGLSF